MCNTGNFLNGVAVVYTIDGQPIGEVDTVTLEKEEMHVRDIGLSGSFTIKNTAELKEQLDKVYYQSWRDKRKTRLMCKGVSEEVAEYCIDQAIKWAISGGSSASGYLDAIENIIDWGNIQEDERERQRYEMLASGQFEPFAQTNTITTKILSQEPRQKKGKKTKPWEKNHFWSK